MIAIASVGHRLDPEKPKHKAILEDLGVEVSPNEVGAYEDFYELTYEGEPLNLNEYATWIADTREIVSDIQSAEAVGSTEGEEFNSATHVIVMDDV